MNPRPLDPPTPNTPAETLHRAREQSKETINRSISCVYCNPTRGAIYPVDLRCSCQKPCGSSRCLFTDPLFSFRMPPVPVFGRTKAVLAYEEQIRALSAQLQTIQDTMVQVRQVVSLVSGNLTRVITDQQDWIRSMRAQYGDDVFGPGVFEAEVTDDDAA